MRPGEYRLSCRFTLEATSQPPKPHNEAERVRVEDRVPDRRRDGDLNFVCAGPAPGRSFHDGLAPACFLVWAFGLAHNGTGEGTESLFNIPVPTEVP